MEKYITYFFIKIIETLIFMNSKLYNLNIVTIVEIQTFLTNFLSFLITTHLV